jgi:hypothetical protein
LCSDDEDVLREENSGSFDTGFGNIIVVDNLPVVPKEKFEKLEGVVRKIYGQIGVIKDDGLWMPVDPATGKSLGDCFIEYNTPQVKKSFMSNKLFVFIVLLCIRLDSMNGFLLFDLTRLNWMVILGS